MDSEEEHLGCLDHVTNNGGDLASVSERKRITKAAQEQMSSSVHASNKRIDASSKNTWPFAILLQPGHVFKTMFKEILVLRASALALNLLIWQNFGRGFADLQRGMWATKRPDRRD